MGKYGGWHPVCDHRHSLIAVSYEPVEGTLCCKFHSTEQPYLYAGVPENIFHILLRSKYAGAYLRKHVIGRYRCLNEKPKPYEPKEKIVKRLPEREVSMSPQMDLFGVVVSASLAKRLARV